MADRSPGPIYVPNVANCTSSNNGSSSLPPPRFQPGSTGGIRQSMQKDPLLKLIPAKRILDSQLPPLPSTSTIPPPSKRPRQRGYSVGALPVTQKWEDELDLWANQEIEILGETDKDLAKQELQLVFGSAGKQAMDGIRNTLRTSSNPRQFLYCKKTIATMLNRHRTEANPRAPLIPINIDDALPEAARRFSTPSTSTPSVPPVPSTAPTTAFASPEPRDVKPEIITLSDDDDEPPPPRVMAPLSAPRSNPVPAPPPPLVAPSLAPPPPPQGKLYQLRGMKKPFPRYLVEVYLASRRRFGDARTSRRMIKGIYPAWVEKCGSMEADEFIAALEKMAVEEDRLGGPTAEETQRRIQCLTYVADSGTIAKTQPSSRQHSPESTRTQSAAQNSSQAHPPSTSQAISRPRHSPSPPPPPPPPDLYKPCNKCANDGLTCDGNDPCGPCVTRGRFHLCTFPDPPTNERDESLAQSLQILRSRRQSGNTAAPSSSSMNHQHSSSSSMARQASGGGGGGGMPQNHSPTVPIARQPPPPLSSSLNAASSQPRPIPARNTSFPPPSRQPVSLEQAREIARNASNRSRHNSGSSHNPTSDSTHATSTVPHVPREAPSQPLVSPNSPPQPRRDSHGRLSWTLYEGPAPQSSSTRTHHEGRPPSSSNRPTSLDARTQQAATQSSFAQPQSTSSQPPPPPPPSASSLSTPHVPQQQNPSPRIDRRSNPIPNPALRRNLFRSPAWQQFLQGLPPHLHVLNQCAAVFQPSATFGSQSHSRPGSSSDR